jgi:hypothetical protein
MLAVEGQLGFQREQTEQVVQVAVVQVNIPQVQQQPVLLIQVAVVEVGVKDCRAQQAALALSSSSTQSYRLLRLM